MSAFIIQIFCIVIIGYLFGCLNPAYAIGLLKGYDIRTQGSGNAGASNVVILVGKGAGLFVALFDIFKAAVSWKLAEHLFPLLAFAGPLAGVACIMGHMFPVTMHFHGGKGLACLGGVVLAYDPKALLVLLCVALAISVITNYLAITTSTMGFLFPVYYWLKCKYIIGTFILLIPALPIVYRHRENFRRMAEGKELRFSYLWNKEKEIERLTPKYK